MIRARVVLDELGCVKRFEAEGHALLAPKGGDIACSAFSALARSAYEALAALPGAALDADAADRGRFVFEVLAVPSISAERAAGIASFLLLGLRGLERDFPGSVRLTVER